MDEMIIDQDGEERGDLTTEAHQTPVGAPKRRGCTGVQECGGTEEEKTEPRRAQRARRNTLGASEGVEKRKTGMKRMGTVTLCRRHKVNPVKSSTGLMFSPN